MWLWGTAAAKDGAIATGGFALIRLKPCAGYSPIHGLRFAVRLSLAVGFMGINRNAPRPIEPRDDGSQRKDGRPLLQTFSGLEKYLFVVILPCAC